ncbi:stage II sporulation protein M [Methanoplanus sp. FWC-SCC4]|uniref:Stage II sporulation protein M n=1 Tax=Methanochimaera problematica TaxID=2609417 RepID=A0AA97I419_9EURY|nr:stage II sporulation protein M [Methanoplanus sp. FWC-SCC4]WOF15856.1 stage II sporulation protein M [Methanoplanus sp. FWC-SCC4]
MFKDRLLFSSIFALIIFITFAMFGAFSVAQDKETAGLLLDSLKDQVFSNIMDDNPFILSVNLFVNNLEASLLLFIGGATFGLLTMFVLITNGIIIGFVVSYVSDEKGILSIMASIIPHGIFEIPAFIIAAGLGFLLTEALWMEFKGVGDTALSAKKYAKKFVLYVCPLLAVAAVIEAFITPKIIDLVLQGVL